MCKVCVKGWLRRSLDVEGRLTKFLYGFVGCFVFISIFCAGMGVLRMVDFDVSEGDVEKVNWIIVIG